MQRVRFTRFVACTLLAAVGLSARADAADAAVVLNEINCQNPDWIELVNTGSTAADVSGWILTDDALGAPGADPYEFPDPTTIAANDDLVVDSGAAGFPFGISCLDTIRLADATATLVDETTLSEPTIPGDTRGRYPSGTGAWAQTAPTKGEPNQPSSGGDTDAAAWMFEPGTVVEIGLDLPQSSLDAIELDPDTYQPGAFSLQTTGASYSLPNIGVRLKGGAGSFRPLSGKAAFKLKFDEFGGPRFLGLKRLTLNNMVQDKSMIHEVLAYEAFRAAGIDAPRTGYANVRVNQSQYGLYLNVETPDSVALGRWFDSTQHLYEGEYGVDVVPESVADFEVDEGDESDLSDLEDMTAAAASEEPPDFSDRVAGLIDLQQMTKMWAVERYIGHWDGYTGDFINNYYLHSDAGGLFSMLPWGTDQTWEEDVLFGGQGPYLFTLCMADESCAGMYRQAVIDARDAIVTANLDPLAVSTATVLGPSQAADPRREYTLGMIEAEVAETREFIAGRSAEVDTWLAPRTRITKSPRGVLRISHRRERVGFEFGASVAGSTFECRLDDRERRDCTSPRRFWVGPGRHEFRAWATSPEGYADKSPDVARFRVAER